MPERGVTVIAIANLASADPNLLAYRALDAVLDGRPKCLAESRSKHARPDKPLPLAEGCNAIS